MYACKSLWPPSSWSYLSDDILVSEGTYGEHEKKKTVNSSAPPGGVGGYECKLSILYIMENSMPGRILMNTTL